MVKWEKHSHMLRMTAVSVLQTTVYETPFTVLFLG